MISKDSSLLSFSLGFGILAGNNVRRSPNLMTLITQTRCYKVLLLPLLFKFRFGYLSFPLRSIVNLPFKIKARKKRLIDLAQTGYSTGPGLVSSGLAWDYPKNQCNEIQKETTRSELGTPSGGCSIRFLSDTKTK